MACPPESDRALNRKLTLGYLQVGPAEHGICRYGRMLAAEARRRADIEVIEQNVVLTGRLRTDYQRLRQAARAFSSADLVHLQVSIWADGTWGGDAARGRNARALWHLAAFRLHCRSALTVTLHDLNSLPGLGCHSRLMSLRFAAVEALKGPFRPAVRFLRQLNRRRLHLGRLFRPMWDFGQIAPFLVARWVSSRTQGVFVLTGPERKVLESMRLADKASQIPHFVERGPLRGQPNLGLPEAATTKTVVVAGFMFDSKGHDLVIEAMSLLPDVRVVFVGGPSLGSYGNAKYAELMALARAKGVMNRLTVTGYLPDAEYLRQLASSTLAVCAFGTHKSASGSLSTLIAADCPVLASDIPLIAEYNAISAGAISTFAPFIAEALARRIRELLTVPRHTLTQGLGELRERLSIARIADRHIESYHRVLAGWSNDGRAERGLRRMEPA